MYSVTIDPTNGNVSQSFKVSVATDTLTMMVVVGGIIGGILVRIVRRYTNK